MDSRLCSKGAARAKELNMFKKNFLLLLFAILLITACSSAIDTGKGSRKEIGFPAGHAHHGI